MKKNTSITLSIDTSRLESFCSKLLERSRDITKTHDSLITLESFISVFGRESLGSKEFQEIESTIKSITDKSRQQLLNEYTRRLISALKNCDAKSLTLIHTPLSRNGFYEILKTAISELSDDEIRLVMVWSENWLKEAKELAEEASGYPDSMDLKKAEISIEEFQAMSDIDRVLNFKG